MKPFWKSKTLWLNGLVLLDAAISYVSKNPSLLAVIGLTPAEQVQAVVILNAVLRLFSDTGLTTKSVS